MTHLVERVRTYAGRPLPFHELRSLPGLLVARVLRIGDVPRLLLDASRSDVPVRETVAGKTFSKKPVRRKLGRIAGGKGRPLVAGERVHAIVCVPDWLRMGRYSFGMSGNYYGPVETETLALLALWTGEGTMPRVGACVVETSYHPCTDEARNLLGWHVLEDNWSVEQLEILTALLRDGAANDTAVEIARNPGW